MGFLIFLGLFVVGFLGLVWCLVNLPRFQEVAAKGTGATRFGARVSVLTFRFPILGLTGCLVGGFVGTLLWLVSLGVLASLNLANREDIVYRLWNWCLLAGTGLGGLCGVFLWSCEVFYAAKQSTPLPENRSPGYFPKYSFLGELGPTFAQTESGVNRLVGSPPRGGILRVLAKRAPSRGSLLFGSEGLVPKMSTTCLCPNCPSVGATHESDC